MHNRFVEDYDPTIEGTARVLRSANLERERTWRWIQSFMRTFVLALRHRALTTPLPFPPTRFISEGVCYRR